MGRKAVPRRAAAGFPLTTSSDPWRRGIEVNLRRVLLAASASILTLGLLILPVAPSEPVRPSKATVVLRVQDDLGPAHREPIAPAVAAPALPTSRPQDELRSQVINAISASGAPTWSASVWIDGYGTVMQQAPEQELIPASTQKVFVAAAALSILGPEHRLTTRVVRTAEVSADGSMQGDLVLIGGGDPSLSRVDLDVLARTVAASGVRRVAGGLVVDDSRFDRARTAPGWKPQFVIEESGALSALAVDRNDYRSDPAFIADPALANGLMFREILAFEGVDVAGTTAIAPVALGGGHVVGAKASAPLRDLLRHMLQESDNFYAEMIVKELGASAGVGTTAGGLEVIRRFAQSQRLSLGPSADGSGLSSENRSSAATQMQWLAWIERDLGSAGFQDLMPSACGEVGTLKKRMCGSSGAGKVFAKSGGLPQVATLAGYTTTASGRRVRFAFFLTGSTSGKAARLSIDNALIAITSFTG